MVIHTKKKAEIHRHKQKSTAVKGASEYLVERNPVEKKAVKVDAAHTKRKSNASKRNSKPDKGKKKNGNQSVVQDSVGVKSQGQPKPNSLEEKSSVQTERKSGKTKSIREGMFHKYRERVRKSNESIKISNKPLRTVSLAGAKTMTDQMEGGEEIQQSALLAYGVTKPIAIATYKGGKLVKSGVVKVSKLRVKKMDVKKKVAGKTVKKASKKVAKETGKKAVKETTKEVAKETAKITTKVATKTATTAATTAAGTVVTPGVGTVVGIAIGEAAGIAVASKIEHADMVADTRKRKIKFFFDKMNSQENQKDSLAKLVKDLIFRKAQYGIKQIMTVLAPFLLTLILLVAMIAVPIVAMVGVIYNSPFAIFLPPLESGDTVSTVATSYVADFNREVTTLANNHTGYDEGDIVYVGTGITPNNICDILAVYMVKHGVGDTATVLNDRSKGWLEDVVEDMCTYTISTGSYIVYVPVAGPPAEGETEPTITYEPETVTYMNVNVTLKTWRDMVSVYGFDADEQQLLADFMDPENLEILGY